MVNYENLDNHQTGIHDYFKFLKFGFGRATDIACLHVRRGRITREDALEMVTQARRQVPVDLSRQAARGDPRPLDMTVDEFIRVCDRFTNKKIFETRPSRRAGQGPARQPDEAQLRQRAG